MLGIRHGRDRAHGVEFTPPRASVARARGPSAAVRSMRASCSLALNFHVSFYKSCRRLDLQGSNTYRIEPRFEPVLQHKGTKCDDWQYCRPATFSYPERSAHSSSVFKQKNAHPLAGPREWEAAIKFGGNVRWLTVSASPRWLAFHRLRHRTATMHTSVRAEVSSKTIAHQSSLAAGGKCSCIVATDH